MFARVSIDGERLTSERVGRMTRWFGPSVDVPLEHVVSVELADSREPRRWNLGIRLAGLQIPGYLVSGLFLQRGERTCWHVGRGNTAVVITLRNEPFNKVGVDVADPPAFKAMLERSLASQ